MFDTRLESMFMLLVLFWLMMRALLCLIQSLHLHQPSSIRNRKLDQNMDAADSLWCMCVQNEHIQENQRELDETEGRLDQLMAWCP